MREAGHGAVSTRADERVTVVTIERPERRNAVDFETARALFEAFERFDADPNADVAVLTGAGGFSAPGPISRRSPKARHGRSSRTARSLRWARRGSSSESR